GDGAFRRHDPLLARAPTQGRLRGSGAPERRGPDHYQEGLRARGAGRAEGAAFHGRQAPAHAQGQAQRRSLRSGAQALPRPNHSSRAGGRSGSAGGGDSPITNRALSLLTQTPRPCPRQLALPSSPSTPAFGTLATPSSLDVVSSPATWSRFE